VAPWGSTAHDGEAEESDSDAAGTLLGIKELIASAQVGRGCRPER
jgi:hypothetical protein